MSWVRLDDHFDENPKVERAGPLAAHLYICGLTYAARNLTDGFIPAEKAGRLINVPKADRLVDTLIQAGLWETVDGGYQIHDWEHYNPPATRVREQRRQAAERQARWRETQHGAPLNGRDSGVSNASTHGVSNASSDADVGALVFSPRTQSRTQSPLHPPPWDASSGEDAPSPTLPAVWGEVWGEVFDAEPSTPEYWQLVAWSVEQPCSAKVLRYALVTAKAKARSPGARVAFARTVAQSPPPGVEPFDWERPPDPPYAGALDEIKPGPMDTPG